MTGSDDAVLEASSYPLIVFIHIPKTAGSTVKKVLNLCSPRGWDWVENLIGNQTQFLCAARNSDWISGHIERDRVAKALIWVDRIVDYFACVREPIAQLISSLNWSFEKYSRANYYERHDLAEQQMDAEVMATDFSNPASVINLLFKYPVTYLNVQSRFLVGPDFNTISAEEFLRRLTTYVYVGDEDRLPNLFRSFGFANLPSQAYTVRENVAKQHFDKRIFDTPALQEFLRLYHAYDLRLYGAARATSWPGERRPAFRPAYPAVGVFTRENFDEFSYLRSNPDVAAAVKNGHFQSGRDHFELFGEKEMRLARGEWVLPSQSYGTHAMPGLENFDASSALARIRELRESRQRK